MALSMLVLLVPVFLLVGFYRFLGHETAPVVDTATVYDSAHRANAFPLLTPEGLPSGWRIASATFTAGVLRIGITAPDSGELQVVESAAPAASLVPDVVGRSAQAGEMLDLDGGQWQRFDNGRPGERSLVLSTTGRTVVVVGQATDAQFRRLAESLHPSP